MKSSAFLPGDKPLLALSKDADDHSLTCKTVDLN